MGVRASVQCVRCVRACMRWGAAPLTLQHLSQALVCHQLGLCAREAVHDGCGQRQKVWRQGVAPGWRGSAARGRGLLPCCAAGCWRGRAARASARGSAAAAAAAAALLPIHGQQLLNGGLHAPLVELQKGLQHHPVIGGEHTGQSVQGLHPRDVVPGRAALLHLLGKQGQARAECAGAEKRGRAGEAAGLERPVGGLQG